VSVPVYWIVDPRDEVVEVWTPEATLPDLEHAQAKWEPVGAGRPFTLDIPALFRPL
jgi:Uma2 family endonuclease